MKPLVRALLLLAAMPLHAVLGQSGAAPAGGVSGIWMGSFPDNRSNLLQLHLEIGVASPTCTLDRISGGPAGMPCTDVRFDGRTLSFAIPARTPGAPPAHWSGTLSADGRSMAGIYESAAGKVKGAVRQRLVFEREDAARPLETVDKAAEKQRAQYGPYRANNDLLSYKLRVRVDPKEKSLRGDNQIRFRMLAESARIQIDLYPDLAVDRIVMDGRELKYTRELGAVYIDFPEPLHAGNDYTIDFFYSGKPKEIGRFGGISFGTDPAGYPWIVTACEGEGSSVWWPSKDQWRDEPQEGMEIAAEVPDGLTDVSNGKFVSETKLGDGYTRWTWAVHYPINSYDVSLNIGKYAHWSTTYDHVPVDFYALPADLDKAKAQFPQAEGMLQAFQHYFGEYPFIQDGYKLIEAPYTGMEHQSAVTYGNGFQNSYGGGDWTGVGISPRFDFIIIHESGHEWFGNAVSARDASDMWIHEGWDTYLESLYVEHRWGKADALRYVNGYKSKVQNKEPIVTAHELGEDPTQDQYFKGALFLNTLRSVIDDDAKWFALIRGVYQTFKYRTILTEDVVDYFNRESGMDLTPEFNQYLRHPALPILELRFDPAVGRVSYRWRVDEARFNMPVKVGDPAHWQTITPTVDWQVMPTTLTPDQFQVATDLYYVNVEKSSGQGRRSSRN